MCRKVKEPNSSQTWAIVDALRSKMKAVKACGIAAPQVGINRQIIIVYNEISGTYDEFINPEILEAPETDANMRWSIEGCLSHPGLFAEIARPNHIIFKAQRISEKPRVYQAAGFISRIIQHEVDHLNGLLFTDKKMYFRNPTFDTPGQIIHMDAIRKTQEEGQEDWKVD